MAGTGYLKCTKSALDFLIFREVTEGGLSSRSLTQDGRW